MDNLEKLSAERCMDLNVQNTADLYGIYRSSDAPNAEFLFISYFHIVPNSIDLQGIDAEKANKWFTETYREAIKEHFYTKTYHWKLNFDFYFDNVYYILFDDLLLHINIELSRIECFYRKTDSATVDKIVTEFLKFKEKRSRAKPTIDLLTIGHSGLNTTSMDISKPKLSIEENYNDDFLPIHQTIVNRLRKKNDKGLVLLHGKPGTGKTSYIRYLISIVKKKKVIFLPPNMAACITDPSLMNLLIDNPDSIFVIEDAENIIIDRNRNGSSSVSALLNLADGLLSDCLNIQIICSFNTDLSQVDSALMRKGRLIAKYEFQELETRKAQALSDKLGFSSVITSPMTLAAVYNQNEAEFSAIQQRRTIGFRAAV